MALAEQIRSMVRPTRCSPSSARAGSMTMASETMHSTVRSPEQLIQSLSASFVAWTSDSSDRLMLGYTTSTSFQARMPIADAQSALLHLVVRVRDALGCTTEQNVSSIAVLTNTNSIVTSIAAIQAALANSDADSTLLSDPFVQTLYGGNQTAVCRLLTSLAQAFNLMAKQGLLVAAASKSKIISPSRVISRSFAGSVSISSLTVSPLYSDSSEVRTLQRRLRVDVFLHSEVTNRGHCSIYPLLPNTIVS